MVLLYLDMLGIIRSHHLPMIVSPPAASVANASINAAVMNTAVMLPELRAQLPAPVTFVPLCTFWLSVQRKFNFAASPPQWWRDCPARSPSPRGLRPRPGMPGQLLGLACGSGFGSDEAWIDKNSSGGAVSGRWRSCGCRWGQPRPRREGLTTAVVRFGTEPAMWMSMLMAAGSLAPVAPCGLPLALGCRRLWRRRWRRGCSARSPSPSTR